MRVVTLLTLGHRANAIRLFGNGWFCHDNSILIFNKNNNYNKSINVLFAITYINNLYLSIVDECYRLFIILNLYVTSIKLAALCFKISILNSEITTIRDDEPTSQCVFLLNYHSSNPK